MKKAIHIVLCLWLIGCTAKYPKEVELALDTLPEEIDFNFHVRPILSDRCFHCHGPDEKGRKADLRLDIEEVALGQLSDTGSFPIYPGTPGKSAVVHRLLTQDPEQQMPPPESKLSLTDREKATIIKWIQQGAKWKKHWAYLPPQKAALPEIEHPTWGRNEIDYFVYEKLRKNGLAPSDEADRRTLIRRLSFDLIGLPPTLGEVNQFVLDSADNSYEKVVDRLLASSHFGERWAWEWLDVARYSDTNGFQGDPTRTMWPWRDWVIKAFNENMPYDEFTVKQIAGDLLPEASKEDILATAFNRNHTHNGEGGRIAEETRVENVFDRVETVGTTWMGLTLNCSRCHDHKFDAITQKEYYQLSAYFNQTSENGKGFSGVVPPVLDVSPIEDIQKINRIKSHLKELAEEVDQVETQKFPRADELPPSQSKAAEKIAGGFNGGLDENAFNRNAFQLVLIYRYFKDKDPTYANLLMKLRETKLQLRDQSAKNMQVMVMDQLDEPRPTYILTRGNYSSHEEEVFPNVPAILPSLPTTVSNNRLALALWLISKDNPLTARVTVNRYWQAFFGRGIVKTIEDFGVQGAL
ncbi:MAG: DUF1549 domain-containing protein, partial [Bacteroidota bacterium]